VEPLFALRDVTLVQGQMPVLCDVSLDLPQASVTGIIGPSGGGKTSLIRLLNRLDEPSSGEIRFRGAPLQTYAVRSLRREVAFVFQTATMFSGTVAANLRIAAELGAGAAASPPPEVDDILEAVGLGRRYATREAAELSGGEQQRVGLGRALMTRPRVLLLDEPTSALDPETARRLLTTIVRLAGEQRLCVIMVTHRLSEAREFTTFGVMLEAGRIIEIGPTRELFAGARTARARAYLASA